MEYLSVNQLTKKWIVSEHTVRNYYYLSGKNWMILVNAQKPERKNKVNTSLLDILKREKIFCRN